MTHNDNVCLFIFLHFRVFCTSQSLNSDFSDGKDCDAPWHPDSVGCSGSNDEMDEESASEDMMKVISIDTLLLLA